jgi:GNAT superfamily N-acetyltransferase
MIISGANPADAGKLTEIAFAAKRHWGYSEAWIEQWRETLTITPHYIETYPTFVAVIDREIAGFCAVQIRPDAAWLDHIWVLPSVMKTGVGRALFHHAEKHASEAGCATLRIESDPFAEGFYRRMGAVSYGRVPAPVAGVERSLLLLAKTL